MARSFIPLHVKKKKKKKSQAKAARSRFGEEAARQSGGPRKSVAATFGKRGPSWDFRGEHLVVIRASLFHLKKKKKSLILNFL